MNRVTATTSGDSQSPPLWGGVRGGGGVGDAPQRYPPPHPPPREGATEFARTFERCHDAESRATPMTRSPCPADRSAARSPRLEAREKVTGRAEYTHLMRAARHAAREDLPQHGRARPHQVGRCQRSQESARRLQGHDLRGRRSRSFPTRITARRSTISRSWRSARSPTWASRSRSCSPTDPHVAEEAATLITAEYEELPPVFDEVEAFDNKVLVHDELKPAGTLRRPQAPQGPQGHQHGARLPAAQGRRRQGLRRSRARLRAHLPHPEGPAPRARALLLDRRLEGERRHHLQRRAGTVVRAHRDRAAARLAGEQGAHQGAVSRRRLRRQALHQARSAGARRSR